MNSLNLAQVIGNLTRDPELRQTQNGQAVCTLGVATNRRWKDSSGQMKEEAEFHNIVCWGKLAEIVNQYLKKGAKVFFSGRLQTRTWDDDAGVKHYRTEIVAQDMIMLGGRGEGGAPNVEVKASAGKGEEEVSAEDLPF